MKEQASHVHVFPIRRVGIVIVIVVIVVYYGRDRRTFVFRRISDQGRIGFSRGFSNEERSDEGLHFWRPVVTVVNRKSKRASQSTERRSSPKFGKSSRRLVQTQINRVEMAARI